MATIFYFTLKDLSEKVEKFRHLYDLPELEIVLYLIRLFQDDATAVEDYDLAEDTIKVLESEICWREYEEAYGLGAN